MSAEKNLENVHENMLLPENEKHFRSLIENTSDIIVILNRDATPRYLSPAIERVLGYTPEELIDKNSFDLVHPNEMGKVKRAFLFGTQTVGTAPIIEFRLKRKDGNWGVFEVIGNNLLDDPDVRGLVVNLRDITVRKRAEEKLQESEKRLKLLSSQLLKAQEKERKRIAQELHDSIGQSLTSIKLRVENACSQLKKEPSKLRASSLENIVPTIQEAIEEVRKIVQDLRPSMLDVLGILATLRWFIGKIKTVCPHIRVKTKINIQENEIPDTLKIVIYRVFQESINNIIKHSKAKQILLEISKTDKRIEITIQDNGQGFDIKDVLSLESSVLAVGIASMKERVEHSDGTFYINSAKGKGTTIKTSWPK